jgi:4-nitrophenyl phosphatase
MSKPIRLGAPEEYSELIGRFDTFMLDCDGVIWHGNTLVPGAKEVLTYLRSQRKRCSTAIVGSTSSFGILEKQIIFVTNNATQSRRDYKKKFDKLGIQAEVVECSEPTHF